MPRLLRGSQLVYSLFVLFGCMLTLGSIQAEPQSARPNFVVFFSDDHGQLDSQPYGSTDIRTPNLQALASRGLRFTHAFCASPACGPSRTAMLTGLWPARNGAEPNHKSKRPEIKSLPAILQSLGYEVAVIGKVAHGNFAKEYGFDFFQGPNVGISDTSAVAKYLQNRQSQKPLCLLVGTRHPHVPWSETASYDGQVVKLPPTHVDTPETRTARAQYNTDVSKADQLLGEVRALVTKHVGGETLFAYTADHGAQWPFGKWNLYDAGIRVPLIVEWPGHIAPGTVSDAMVALPDLFPTLIELAGGQVPERIDGRSFAAVLQGKTSTHRTTLFATHSGDGDFNVYPIRCVRTQDWKYIRNLHPEFQHHTHISRSTGSSGLFYWQSWLAAASSGAKEPNLHAQEVVQRYMQRPAEELYDLQNDPWEQHNLATDASQQDRLAEMRKSLDAWSIEQNDSFQVFGKPLMIGQPVTPVK